jgi:hypothetical protein
MWIERHGALEALLRVADRGAIADVDQLRGRPL